MRTITHSGTAQVLLSALISLIAVRPAAARIWEVGPGRTYTLPSQVAGSVGHGDTVNIDAGSYVDCATWTRNNLLLRGVGGSAHLRDKSCGGKAIWIIQGSNTTVEWIEFSGATVVDRNGAGIRQEGLNLTVRHCVFRDNENGILAGDNAASEILVEHSEFARNGYGDGYSHNMYINHVKRFTLRFCYVHHAKVGHDVKSRAYETFILYNRISDESDGTASRSIDLPNGGLAIILGNLIHHGPATQNSNVVGYGMEGLTNPTRSIAVVNNTFVNDRASGAFVQCPASGVDTLWNLNNLYVPMTTSMISGTPARVRSGGNLQVGNLTLLSFVNPGAFDYRLLATSPAIDRGAVPGSFFGIDLLPIDEYVHPAGRRPRTIVGSIDAGAYEYNPPARIGQPREAEGVSIAFTGVTPNPFRRNAVITYHVSAMASAQVRTRLRILDVLGREIALLRDGETTPGTHSVEFSADRYPHAQGLLFAELSTGRERVVRRILLLR